MYNHTNISFKPEDRTKVTTSKTLHDDKRVVLSFETIIIGNPSGYVETSTLAMGELALQMPLDLCQIVVDELTKVMNEIKEKETITHGTN